MINCVINVKGSEITIATRHAQDYSVWEQLNNPRFNSLEFEGIKNEAGRNSLFLTAKTWIDATRAIGLHAKADRYGGSYANEADSAARWRGVNPGTVGHKQLPHKP